VPVTAAIIATLCVTICQVEQQKRAYSLRGVGSLVMDGKY